MYFTFQPEAVLELCLDFNESQPIYAYKRYACIKKKILFSNTKANKKLLVKYMLACSGEMLTKTK